jgi:hypothetical protein
LSVCPGKQGWWNAELFWHQQRRLIDIWEFMHPTKTLVMLFDNSSGHTCRTETSLNTNNMNMGPGGTEKGRLLPDMHPTVWNGKDKAGEVMNAEWAARYENKTAGERNILCPAGPRQEIKRLGMKAILQERGLMTLDQRPSIVWDAQAKCWKAATPDSPKMDTDAARKLLATCDDFANEPYEVQNIYGGPEHHGKRKHIGTFLAKFHPGGIVVLV